MKSKISTEKLSDYIVSYFYYNNNPINTLKLQKLLYCIQRDYVLINKEPLFVEEFLASKLGPALNSINKKYCKYGALPIIFDITDNYDQLLWDSNLEAKDIAVIHDTIDRYFHKDCFNIINELKNNNTAWYFAYHNKENKSIAFSDILKYN